MFRNGIFIKSRHMNPDRSFRTVDSVIGPDDVADGLAYTLMVAEKRVSLGLLGSTQAGDRLGWTTGFGVTTLRTGGFSPQRDATDDSDMLKDQFGSAHPSGMNALFADGSVRTISYQISDSVQVLQVWSPLLAPMGVQPLPSPPYPPCSIGITLFQRLCHRADGGTVNWAEVE